nr:5198_t:CDS:2 [Entrophospora candida]
MLGSLFTIANLSNGKKITIYAPGLEKAQILVENNTNSDLPPAQLIFYLTLLNELAKQVPNFDISNVELAKVFTNSWRNSSLEYTDDTMLGSLFTIAKLSNGETIAIYAPGLGKAQILVENNANSDLPPAQLIFYLTLLNELAKQIPNFDVSNMELAKVFTDSWRNFGLEYTDEFVILADKLGLN